MTAKRLRIRNSQPHSLSRVASCTIVEARCGLHTRAVTKTVTVIRRLQTFRLLHACSGCFWLERSPGGACTRWKSAALSRPNVLFNITKHQYLTPQYPNFGQYGRTYGIAGTRAAAGGADLRSLPLSERRSRLQAIWPAKSPIVSEALSITGRGCELFEFMCSNHLERIAAKRLTDPYEPRVQWLKVKNPSYSQTDGRGDLFNGPRRRPARSAEWR